MFTAYLPMAKRQRNFTRSRKRLAPYNRAKNRARFTGQEFVTRCELQGMKIAYATYGDAEEAIERITESRGVALRIYRCGGHFHLTSNV